MANAPVPAAAPVLAAYTIPTEDAGRYADAALDEMERTARHVAEELTGSAGASDTPADRGTAVTAVEELRDVVLTGLRQARKSSANTDEVRAAGLQVARESLNELEGMARLPEVTNLNKAAVALAGVATLVTGLFSAFGFSSGDYQRMFRDFFPQAFFFLFFASAALILGTFAFVVEAEKSNRNLWAERVAVYFGIGCVGVTFTLGAWGLATGQSAGATRPVISASLDTTATPTIVTVSAQGAGVPRLQHLIATIWETTDGITWNVLRRDVVGPDRSGNASDTVKAAIDASYQQIVATAALESGNTDVPKDPPPSCLVTESGKHSPDFIGSCVLIERPPPK